MIIDKQLLDYLSTQAKANPRLRQNYDLRTSSEDNSQRMLNALELGTILPVHRHTNTTETLVIVRGNSEDSLIHSLRNGEVTEIIILEAGGEVPMLQILVASGIPLKCSKKEQSSSRRRMGRMNPLL